MTTQVISFFTSQGAHASFENHRRYCASRGYAHHFVDASGIGWAHLRMLFEYQTLLRRLRAAADGDLVLLLTQDCLIVRDVACEALMADATREHFIASMDDSVIAGFQLWRNTPASRDRVERLCAAARFGASVLSESGLLRTAAPLAFTTSIEGVHAVVPAAWHIDPMWTQWRAFTVALGDIPDAPPNQPVHADLRDPLRRTHQRMSGHGPG